MPESLSHGTRIKNPTAEEIASFQTLQSLLTKSSYLVHADPSRPLYIDLDSSKEFGFAGMLYHVKAPANLDGKGYPPRKAIEPYYPLFGLSLTPKLDTGQPNGSLPISFGSSEKYVTWSNHQKLVLPSSLWIMVQLWA